LLDTAMQQHELEPDRGRGVAPQAGVVRATEFRCWWYASRRDRGIRMSVKRKSHNLDETLLRRAKAVLGAATETDAIHDALRAVLVGEDMLADLEAARAEGIFRPSFERGMRSERRRAR
jgi:Arc/MetJ family transcription regulator